MRLSSLAPVVLLLVAGCMGSGGGDGTGEPTRDSQPDHMPRQALFSHMRLLDAETDASWFEAYGMDENPGSADPDSFSTGSGLVPQTAYVALYAYDGDRSRIFTAATMHYGSAGQVAQYLDEHGECSNPSPGRSILVDGLDVTILVAGLELSGSDEGLMAALHEAEDDVMERTGADIEC